MSSFKSARPLQDVRLKNWSGGRVAALKLMISRLEDALNKTLGAQVDQDVARVTSDQVPFIINFRVEGGYRIFKIDFPTPPGLVDLLFYEIFHDDNAGFTSPTILRTPMTNIMISAVGLNETRFFKARVVNSSFEASVFTDTLEVVSASKKIDVTNISGVDTVVTTLNKDAGVFIDVIDFDYVPRGGALTMMAHVGLAGAQGDAGGEIRGPVFLANAPNRGIPGDGVWHKNFGPGHAQFRWVIDGRVARFPRFMLSQRPFNSVDDGVGSGPPDHGFSQNSFRAPWGVISQGTMITPFFRTEKLSINVKLQAALNLGSEWQGGLTNLQGDPPTPARSEGAFQIEPLVLARNIKVIEVQEEF